MSPPVLGTLLGLCLVYIMPKSGEGVVPRPLVPLPCLGTPSNDSTESESETLVLDPSPYPTLLSLDARSGLFEVHRLVLSKLEAPCQQCGLKFDHTDVVYATKCNKNRSVQRFHESCILIWSEQNSRHPETLERVEEFIRQCPPENLEVMESLFKVQDDLVRVNVWEIDDENDECSPPHKLRRMQNHIAGDIVLVDSDSFAQ